MKLQLKRSLKTSNGLAQAPSVDQMEYGELAVNYVSSDPSIFLKDSTNTIRKMQLGILPDTSDSSSQSGTLDERYLLKVGGTLTGNVAAPSFVGGVARMSAVAPGAAEDGELWWNNNDGRLYIYYNDGATTQWVDASPDSFTLGAGYYDKNEADARYIAKAGGIMTGILQLAGNPATSLAAAPKQYVDSQATAAQTAAQNFATAAIASIPATDLTAYDTSVQVDAKIAAIPATDLSSYDTSAEVDAKIAAIPATDLSSYDTSTEVDAKIAANTPDLSDYSGTIVADGLTVKGGSGASGKIQLNCENNSHGVMIEGPAHSAGATYTLILPPNTGTADQVLTTDGSGSMTWTSKLSLSSLPTLP